MYPETSAQPRRPRGGGGISYDAAKGKWRITWPIRGQRPGRRWIDGSRIDAERELRRELNARDAGGPRRDHRMTLEGWLRLWLESHVAAKATGTQIRYRDICERLIIPDLGHRKLAELDAEEIGAFKARLMRDGHNPRGADSILDVLSAALGQAVRSGRLGHNPRTRVARSRQAPQRIDPPTREEVDRILEAVALDPRWLAIYGLSIGHGLRQSELLGLRHGDRTADGALLRVERKREYRTGRTDEEPKDASTRTVRLLPWVAEALDALPRAAPGAPLFPGSRPGSTLHPKTLLVHLYGLCADLGLRRRYEWHDLRRAFGTRIVAAGSSLPAAQVAMGHRDFRTTRLYLAPDGIVDDLAPPPSQRSGGTTGALTGALHQRQGHFQKRQPRTKANG